MLCYAWMKFYGVSEAREWHSNSLPVLHTNEYYDFRFRFGNSWNIIICGGKVKIKRLSEPPSMKGQSESLAWMDITCNDNRCAAKYDQPNRIRNIGFILIHPATRESEFQLELYHSEWHCLWWDDLIVVHTFACEVFSWIWLWNYFCYQFFFSYFFFGYHHMQCWPIVWMKTSSAAKDHICIKKLKLKSWKYKACTCVRLKCLRAPK